MLNKIKGFGCGLFVILLLVACGGGDGDMPGHHEVFEEGTSELASDDESSLEVVEEYEAAPEEEEDLGVGEAEVEESERGAGLEDDEGSVVRECTEVCFKRTLCSDDGDEFESCLATCEATEFRGVVSDWDMRCLLQAETCGEVKLCEYEIEVCQDVCGMYEYCGTYGDIDTCHGWCIGEVWAGRLDVDAWSCAWDAGVHDRCEELGGCGFSEPIR